MSKDLRCCRRDTCICGATNPIHPEIEKTVPGAPRMRRILDANRVVWDIATPLEHDKAAKEVFGPESQKVDQIEGLFLYEVTYHRLNPNGATVEDIQTAQKLHIQLFTELKVLFTIPRSLLEAIDVKKVRLLIENHGGGGFTGHPRFRPWRYDAYDEYIRRAGDMVIAQFELPSMPESDGQEIRSIYRLIWSWLFQNLEETLELFNENIRIAWDHINLSGTSFGAEPSLGLLYYADSMEQKPSNFRIPNVHLISPLVHHYSRDRGEYMGMNISAEKVDQDLENIVKARKSMPWIIKRAGAFPHKFMYLAYATSTSEKYPWSSFWNANSTFEMVQGHSDFLMDKDSPNHDTKVWIRHGKKDIHVKYGDSVELADLFRSKGLTVQCDLIEDKGHAWLYKSPLDGLFGGFLDEC